MYLRLPHQPDLRSTLTTLQPDETYMIFFIRLSDLFLKHTQTCSYLWVFARNSSLFHERISSTYTVFALIAQFRYLLQCLLTRQALPGHFV